MRTRDPRDPLLEVRPGAWPTVWSTFLDQSEARIRNFLAMLHDLARADELLDGSHTHVLRLRPDLLVWEPLPASVFDDSRNLYVVSRSTYVGGNEDNLAVGRADVARAALRRGTWFQDPRAWRGWNATAFRAYRETARSGVARPPGWPGAFYSPHFRLVPDAWWPEDLVARAVERAGGAVREAAGLKARVVHAADRHAPPAPEAGNRAAVLVAGADVDDDVASRTFSVVRDEMLVPLRADLIVVGDDCRKGAVAVARRTLAGAFGAFGESAPGCRGFARGSEWHRLRCAWALLEEAEEARAQAYEIIIRAKPDRALYPWDAAAVAAAAAARRDVLFGASGAFWGARPAAAVALQFPEWAFDPKDYSARALRDSLASGALADVPLAPGALHSPGPRVRAPRAARGEGAFAAWLLHRNVTVCDAGAARELARGVARARTAAVCQAASSGSGA